jgi:hypothetical protein
MSLGYRQGAEGRVSPRNGPDVVAKEKHTPVPGENLTPAAQKKNPVILLTELGRVLTEI